MSPLLFTIVVETLSSLLVKARELGMINGFQIGRSGEIITHFQFADDIILFSSTKLEEILALTPISLPLALSKWHETSYIYI